MDISCGREAEVLAAVLAAVVAVVAMIILATIVLASVGLASPGLATVLLALRRRLTLLSVLVVIRALRPVLLLLPLGVVLAFAAV